MKTKTPFLTWTKPMTSKQATRYLLTKGFVAAEYSQHLERELQTYKTKTANAMAILSKKNFEIEDKCTCPTECDCSNPPPDGVNAIGTYHLSNSCPVHNNNPDPDPQCPVHGDEK